MPVEYALRIKDTGGTLRYVVTGQGSDPTGEEGGFRSLAYSKKLNGVGVGRFVLNASHDAVADLDHDWRVEVQRWDDDNSIDEYTDYYGFWRDEERRADSDGNSIYVAYLVEQKEYLARDIVAYPAATTDRNDFTNKAAETVAKNIVTYNCTAAGGTADGRHFAVEPWTDFISVQADGGAGGSIDYRCANKNVMEALQDVARIGGGDFDLVQTSGTAWQFRWYNGQLGADRSGSVTFSLAHGNMENPVLRRNKLQEHTVVIVGGQGEEADRSYVRRTGTNYDGTVNARVVFVPATQYSATDGLNAAGDVRLDEMEAKDDLTFDVLQTPSTLYGKHYFLGDLVTGYYQGVTATKQIVGVTVEVTTGGERTETIRIETENA